jgi:hypothetical protein
MRLPNYVDFMLKPFHVTSTFLAGNSTTANFTGKFPANQVRGATASGFIAKDNENNFQLKLERNHAVAGFVPV